MNSDDLNELINEELVTEKECNAADLRKLDQLTEFNQHFYSDSGKCNSELVNTSFPLTVLRDVIEDVNSMHNYSVNDFRVDVDPKSESLETYRKSLLKKTPNPKTNVIAETTKNRISRANNRLFNNDKKFIKVQQPEIPKFKERVMTNVSDHLFDLYEETKYENPIKKDINTCMDNTELENKINDSLLDMLQGEMMKHCSKASASEKQTDDSSKYITIFPTMSTEKLIHVTVKGKTCRSKEPLNKSELRIVNRIVNQENMLGRNDEFYKNVYYDAETDTNIRYEVRRCRSAGINPRSNYPLHTKSKRTKLKSNQRVLETNDKGTDEVDFVWNKVARTRFGRISRPPRHVVRDYKHLKHSSSESNIDVEENENSGGIDDFNATDENGEKEYEKRGNILYGLLEPNRRQFSSLSKCPTCNKVYLGYRRMAIHFQKYPDHKNEDFLKQLLESKKKEMNEYNGIWSDNPTKSGLHCTLERNQPNKKRKLNHKIKTPSLQNPATCIKELLSLFGPKEIVKYAGPIVADTLDSWEYLVMRTQLKKKSENSLFHLLVDEIEAILNRLRTVSSYVLKSITSESETALNKFKIEQNDVLQNVLGVSPGTYVIADNAESHILPNVCDIVSPIPDRDVQPVDNMSAKLFDAAVAECLKEEPSELEDNTELSLTNTSSCNELTISSSANLLNSNVIEGRNAADKETSVVSLNDESTLPNISFHYIIPEITPPNAGVSTNTPNTLNFRVLNQNRDVIKFKIEPTETSSTYSFEKNTDTIDDSHMIDASSLPLRRT